MDVPPPGQHGDGWPGREERFSSTARESSPEIGSRRGKEEKKALLERRAGRGQDCNLHPQDWPGRSSLPSRSLQKEKKKKKICILGGKATRAAAGRRVSLLSSPLLFPLLSSWLPASALQARTGSRCLTRFRSRPPQGEPGTGRKEGGVLLFGRASRLPQAGDGGKEEN